MKWYIASRMRHKKFVNKVIKLLNTHDQEIIFDWSNTPSLKPYKDNADKACTVAKEISSALQDVDVFVLLSDKAGTDMFIELGIALSTWMKKKNTKIYAVGEDNNRSLMHFHPAIKQEDNLKEVFSKECPQALAQVDGNFFNF